jgi:aryl-alcohol dehydrogenase-like predicted oxidoreductase
MPWAPVGGTRGLRQPALEEVAKAHNATVYQVALAWLLQRSPVMLPIPGTASVQHLKENVAAGSLSLTADDLKKLDSLKA